MDLDSDYGTYYVATIHGYEYEILNPSESIRYSLSGNILKFITREFTCSQRFLENPQYLKEVALKYLLKTGGDKKYELPEEFVFKHLQLNSSSKGKNCLFKEVYIVKKEVYLKCKKNNNLDKFGEDLYNNYSYYFFAIKLINKV